MVCLAIAISALRPAPPARCLQESSAGTGAEGAAPATPAALSLILLSSFWRCFLMECTPKTELELVPFEG